MAFTKRLSFRTIRRSLSIRRNIHWIHYSKWRWFEATVYLVFVPHIRTEVWIQFCSSVHKPGAASINMKNTNHGMQTTEQRIVLWSNCYLVMHAHRHALLYVHISDCYVVIVFAQEHHRSKMPFSCLFFALTFIPTAYHSIDGWKSGTTWHK